MKVWLCPQCGSGKNVGQRDVTLVGDDPEVKCENCGWKGKQSELYVTEIEPRMAGGDAADDVIDDLGQAILQALYKHISIPIGLALKEVQLLPEKELRESRRCQMLAARLVRAGVLAAWRGVVGEMDAIDKEVAAAREEPN